MTDRAIHAPEHQTGMHLPKARPACWTDDEPVSERAAVFWDRGRACGAAQDPRAWAITLHHTPTCYGCARARRALALRAGVAC